MKEYFASFRDARLIQILKVEVNEGDGTPEDPIRRVAYYLAPDTGKVLFHTDDKERKFAGEDPMIK